ncbi:transporter substrate-binding domain-containing protein [bacterium]|nr:transporter substrate-binding domain-containing protein [bacterium]
MNLIRHNPWPLKTVRWIAIILIFSFPGLISAKELLIAFPLNLPPWTLQASDSGITVEIVRKSLKLRGYHVTTRYLSLKALNDQLKTGFDAYAQVESRQLQGYYSDKILDFQTSLISLQFNDFAPRVINDLADMQLTAFPNASRLFGKAFQAMAEANPRYEEIDDQEDQVVRLYNGQTSMILIDRFVFLYFRRITALTNTSMPITYHQISGLTEKSPAFVVFQDKALMTEFNMGFKQLKDNDDYYNIVYQYTN